jgi:hypothetical protein
MVPRTRRECFFEPGENVVTCSFRLGRGEAEVVVEADLFHLT